MLPVSLALEMCPRKGPASREEMVGRRERLREAIGICAKEVVLAAPLSIPIAGGTTDEFVNAGGVIDVGGTCGTEAA